MRAFHIVTDSCANVTMIPPGGSVTVVPNRISIGGRTYREGVDLSNEEAQKLIARQKTPPIVTPPTEADFARVYSQVSRHSDAIISIHASREIYSSWYNAKKASQPLSAHGKIAVIDSRGLCMAQGLLVQVVARLIQHEQSFDEIIRQARAAAERVYAIYYVETLDYLIHSRIINAPHGILGSLLGIKPFVTLENGLLTPTEKVRTRAQAVERLVEFSVEFDNIEQAFIMQGRENATETTRMLQDRLVVEFPGQPFTTAVYQPSMAALIGAEAYGLVILEKEFYPHDLED